MLMVTNQAANSHNHRNDEKGAWDALGGVRQFYSGIVIAFARWEP